MTKIETILHEKVKKRNFQGTGWRYLDLPTKIHLRAMCEIIQDIITEQPPNTQIHVDEDFCDCDPDERKIMIEAGLSFCHWCGKSLHQ